VSYLDELAARSVDRDRQRDLLLNLRRAELAAARDAAKPALPDVTAPSRHRRWHEVLVRLHLVSTRTS
jgi:hypothetical protein